MSSKRKPSDKIGECGTTKCLKLSAQKNDFKNTLQNSVTKDNIESNVSISPCNTRLSTPFFEVPCIDLARALLGQYLVRMVGTQRVSGRIVETEAYLGLEDKAAHSYKGKRTQRNEAMFMQPGTAYVYNIYGMYCCLNISAQGDGCAVLVRALEPIENIEVMKAERGNRSTKKLKNKDMTNGPSKLCQALQISKQTFNQTDLCVSDLLWLEKGDNIHIHEMICCPRINIGYSEEWKHKPLRFYISGNECVSVKDKTAEVEKAKSTFKVQ
uniref:DNA-3-methyladenine glycosylase n=2 Tax=Arion vulgaris TaxID=1028688 RepID=A0A0B7AAI9_9EUPU